MLWRTDRDEEFTAYATAERSRYLRTATLLAAGDHHLAEDLVQGAFVRIYLAWPRVRAGTRHAYMNRILVNLLLDEKRRRGRRPDALVAAVPERPVPVPAPADGAGTVAAALAALPEGMRAAVVLRYWCDLDVAATARALGCSQGNVKSQAARGLDHLRRILDHEFAYRRTS